jgi:hypothetical protein
VLGPAREKTPLRMPPQRRFGCPHNASEDGAGCCDTPKLRWMSAREPLDMRVLRVIEELLKDRPPGARPVDTALVLQRMRERAEAEPEVAEAMGQLLAKGDIEGKPLRGDNRVMDVTVMAITEQGLQRLDDE